MCSSFFYRKLRYYEIQEKHMFVECILDNYSFCERELMVSELRKYRILLH